MSRHRRPPPPGPVPDPLLSWGLLLLLGSAVLGALSFLLGGLPPLRALGAAVRQLLWVTAWLGLALVALHALQRLLGQRQEPPKPIKPDLSVVGGHADPAPADAVWRNRTNWGRHEPTAPAATPNNPVVPARWSADVFARIEWRRFEAVVEALFAQAGFQTRSQSHGADGGVDIWLHSRHAEGPVSVVQCKHWQGRPVGVKELREFLGVMTAHRLERGTYATSSRFTEEAQGFARANRIHTLDGQGLLKLIDQRSTEEQARLLVIAFEGEYWRPTCASCGIKLVERKPRSGGRPFWGCRNYPRCKSTLPMRSG